MNQEGRDLGHEGNERDVVAGPAAVQLLLVPPEAGLCLRRHLQNEFLSRETWVGLHTSRQPGPFRATTTTGVDVLERAVPERLDRPEHRHRTNDQENEGRDADPECP